MFNWSPENIRGKTRAEGTYIYEGTSEEILTENFLEIIKYQSTDSRIQTNPKRNKWK